MTPRLEPPSFFLALASRALPKTPEGRSVLGDLIEEFYERAATDAPAAQRWFKREALSVSVRTGRTRTDRTGRTNRTGGTHSPHHGTHGTHGRDGDSYMRQLLSDVRTSIRVLRKQPRFTIVASLTLALGIGATTAIFSVVNGVLLTPLPYPDDERLVDVQSSAPGLGYDEFGLSPDIHFAYAAGSRAFSGMTLMATQPVNLTGDGEPEQVRSLTATHTMFSTMGIAPAIGQPFGSDDDKPGAAPVALISDRLWRRRFGGRPDVVGQTLRIDDRPARVLGVMPARLDDANSPDVWTPLGLDPAQPPIGNFRYRSIGRLADGVSIEQAEASLVPIVTKLVEEQSSRSPDYRAFLVNGRYRPLAESLRENIIGDVRQPLWILLGTVGFVLLIACANVASLCLIRAEARQREVAVRAALGARRSVLVRQQLVEAGVLAAIGGILGIGVAATATPALLALAPSTLPRLNAVTMDVRVVLFAIAAAALSGLIFGLVPAIRYTRARAFQALRQGGRGTTDGRVRQRGRQALVIAQTALAMILLVGSGLLARSFAHLVKTDLGFDPADVVTFRVSVPPTSYPQAADLTRFTDQLVERLRQMPGVESAGSVTLLPLVNNAPGTAYVIDGRPLPPGQLPPLIHYKNVSAGYFETMRIPIERGRTFDSRDSQDTARGIVINRAFAAQYFPEEDPIGRRMRISGETPENWYTIVGVVGSERQNGIREAAPSLIYHSLGGRIAGNARTMTYVVRGPGIATRAAELRAAVWQIDPKLPIALMQSMDDVVARSIVQFSFTMLTLGIAAVIALLLGAIGLYGVLSYAVTLRVREIGVRLALGAQPSRVMRSVVASGAVLAAIGLVVGLAGAAALTRVLEGLLFETKALDPLTFAAMSGVMAFVALLASYLPARKAASVSPLESMRGE